MGHMFRGYAPNPGAQNYTPTSKKTCYVPLELSPSSPIPSGSWSMFRTQSHHAGLRSHGLVPLLLPSFSLVAKTTPLLVHFLTPLAIHLCGFCLPLRPSETLYLDLCISYFKTPFHSRAASPQ